MYQEAIAALKEKTQALEAKQAEYEVEKAELAYRAENYKDAFENAYEAIFDGLKYVSTPEKAFPLDIPMMVKANIHYKDVAGNIYVAVQTGEVTKDNFAEYLEPMNLGE